MLQIGAIEPATWVILKKLMSIPELADFSLVGGTALKVNAILKRAVKKDFWDIAELLEHYTVEEIINNYNKKFSNQMLLISIPRALTYFQDVEDSDDPVSLKEQNWMSVKTKIRDKIDEFLK